MKKVLSILVLTAVIFACKKDDETKLPPTISIKTSEEYTPNGAIVEVGRKLTFGIKASGSSENITNFTISKRLNNGLTTPVFDTALYNMNIDIDKIFYQNVEDTVTWIFKVMDRNRMTAYASLVVYKDPNSQFGGIHYYPLIILGYQDNTVYNHFLNAQTGTVLSNVDADANPNLIDIMSYQYLDSDGILTPAFSSPGEMDNFSTYPQTFYPIITGWSVRNYTKWDISLDNGNNAPLTASDFDSAQNDSLLIVSYHDIWGKKKFKYVTAGKIIPFMTSAGKKGLIKVLHADNVDGTGRLEFSMKIQQ